MNDYTQVFVDKLLDSVSVKGMPAETRQRLSQNLRATLIARVNNAIYEQLNYEQLLRLYNIMDDGGDVATNVANYLQYIGLDVPAITREVRKGMIEEYQQQMNLRNQRYMVSGVAA